MDLWSTDIYTGTSTGTSTGSMTRGRSIGFGSRTDTALRSSLLSTISYLVRLASYFLLGNGMPALNSAVQTASGGRPSYGEDIPN